MSTNLTLSVKSNADENTDLVELLEELYLMAHRLSVAIESDYLGDKVCVNPRGYAFIPAAEGGQRFYRRTPRKGWLTAEGGVN